MDTCPKCGQQPPAERLFCHCGSLQDRDALKRVRLLGPIGVAHTNSAKVDAFLRGPDAGNPQIFEKDYRAP